MNQQTTDPAAPDMDRASARRARILPQGTPAPNDASSHHGQRNVHHGHLSRMLAPYRTNHFQPANTALGSRPDCRAQLRSDISRSKASVKGAFHSTSAEPREDGNKRDEISDQQETDTDDHPRQELTMMPSMSDQAMPIKLKDRKPIPHIALAKTNHVASTANTPTSIAACPAKRNAWKFRGRPTPGLSSNYSFPSLTLHPPVHTLQLAGWGKEHAHFTTYPVNILIPEGR
jgi:hypothetical protein